MSDEIESTDKPIQLPYGAEYAKSGRSSCKGCKEPIKKDHLRMSFRFQSPFFDGMQDNWHHFECFWKKARKNINEASIKGLEWIRWEDQESIRQRIADMQEMPDDYNIPKSIIPKLDRAKSSSGKCVDCKEKLHKGEMRISFKASFHHIQCFSKLNIVKKGAETISGYELMDDSEKATLDKLFSSEHKEEKAKEGRQNKRKTVDKENNEEVEEIENQPGSSKRLKTIFGENRENRKKMKAQTELLLTVVEEIRSNLNRDEIEEILLDNGIFKYKKDSLEKRIEILADCITFGVPASCPECPNGVLRFSTSVKSYKCTGNISEFTRCCYTCKNPERQKLKIAKSLAEDHPFLKKYRKPKLSERVYSEAAEEVIAEPPLLNKKKTKSASSGSARMVVKNGCTVDPDCEMAELTHVFIDSETKRPWQVTLGATDIQSGRNSFYKLQLLEHDSKKRYYVFRSWGRIGTKSGGNKTESFNGDLQAAKSMFQEMFTDKTRNNWDEIENFKKHPFGMNIIGMELDGSECETNKPAKIDLANSTSKLPEPIKRLLVLIFDIDKMNSTMQEFEIDLNEMPLGKLSRKHILSAYQVLSDIQAILQSGSDPHTLKIQCIDASNRFYTLIPHNTGMKVPPLLDNLDRIRVKTNMLDNLLEMQLAYSIIKSENSNKNDKDILDQHYDKLNCSMEVVERDSPDFKMIEKYARNTHADTHGHYRLEIVDVLKLNREGDQKRFKSNLGNRHLLWHGSRASNYAGILSQGLRIAPPEAPATGYMFGKGIYTADMVSKSANYCYAHCNNEEGLLVLCDVALGNVYELRYATELRHLPEGKHSVKGIGGTVPNPTETDTMSDGIKVPCGKPVNTNNPDCNLLYNEYIVYDEAQVRMQYLVRVKFITQLDF